MSSQLYVPIIVHDNSIRKICGVYINNLKIIAIKLIK